MTSNFRVLDLADQFHHAVVGLKVPAYLREVEMPEMPDAVARLGMTTGPAHRLPDA